MSERTEATRRIIAAALIAVVVLLSVVTVGFANSARANDGGASGVSQVQEREGHDCPNREGRSAEVDV